MNTFQMMCKIMKTNTFLGMVVGVNECSLYEIHEFLVDFGVLLAQGSEETWRC